MRIERAEISVKVDLVGTPDYLAHIERGQGRNFRPVFAMVGPSGDVWLHATTTTAPSATSTTTHAPDAPSPNSPPTTPSCAPTDTPAAKSQNDSTCAATPSTPPTAAPSPPACSPPTRGPFTATSPPSTGARERQAPHDHRPRPRLRPGAHPPEGHPVSLIHVALVSAYPTEVEAREALGGSVEDVPYLGVWTHPTETRPRVHVFSHRPADEIQHAGWGRTEEGA